MAAVRARWICPVAWTGTTLPTGRVSVQMLDGAYVRHLRRHNFLGVGKEGGVEGLVSDKDGEPTSGFSLGAQCRTFPSMVIRAECSDAVF